MITKGGMTGLPENDFYKRQKSGDWSIDEHYADINYIRTRSYTPNNYLAIGNYDSNGLLVYSVFSNSVSSLTKNASGTTESSITSIAYNRHVEQLAIGMNKSPYLRVFDTSQFLTPDIYAGSDYKPCFIKRFTYTDLVNGTLSVKHNLDDLHPATAMLSIGMNVSYPYEIQIINNNQVNFIFYEATKYLTGIVYIYASIDNSSYILTDLTSITIEDFTTYRLDVSSNSYINPIFQIYDLENLMIFPSQIQEITANKIYDFEFPVTFNPIDATILVIQGYDTYSEIFIVDSEYTSVTITHNLDSSYLLFQVIEVSTGLIVYPDNIKVQNSNSILITTDGMIPLASYKILVSKAPPDYDTTEILLDPPLSPVFCLEFDVFGDRLIVGTLESENNSHLIEYETANYNREVTLDLLNVLPTTIKVDSSNSYLFVGHYTSQLIDHNLTLYDYSTGEILTDYNFSTLKNLTTDSVPTSLFVNDHNLLVISSYYEPYLHFYDFIQKENVTTKYTNTIGDYIVSRVTNLTKTNDGRYLLIAIDQDPYLYVLDLTDNKIWPLPSESFVSSFTSISLSVNDRYLCITQRDDPKIMIFEFTTTTLTPITLNYTPTTTPLSSIFFFGPVSANE